MSNFIETQGNRSSTATGNSIGGTVQRGGKTILPTSTGGVIMVIVDANRAAAAATYGDRTDVAKIEVFYSSNKVNFTRVANITPTTALQAPYVYAADLYADNSVGIVWVTASGLRFRKVTFSSTATSWTVGTEQTIVTQPTNGNFEVVDISVSDSDTALVAASVAYTTGTTRSAYRLYAQRAGQTAWTQIGSDYSVSTVTERNSGTAIGVCWSKGVLASGRRCFMVIWGGVNTSTDPGFSGWVDSTAENITPTSTLRVQVFSNVLSGALSVAGGWNQHVRAVSIGPTEQNNTFLFGGACIQSVPVGFAGKISFDGTLVTTVLPISAMPRSGRAILGVSTVAVTVGQDAVNIITNIQPARTPGGVIQTPSSAYQNFTQPWNWIASVRQDETGFLWRGPYYYTNLGQPTRDTNMVFGGGGRNARTSKTHDIAYTKSASVENASSGTSLYTQYAVPALIPADHSPKGGSTVATSVPSVWLAADLNKTFPQSPHRAVWEFSKDASFVTSLRSYRQPEDKYVDINSTDAAGYTVRLDDVIPEYLELAQGTWYMRSALRDAFHQQGQWLVNTTTFTISHPPSATNLQPSGAQIINYGTGQVLFAWKMSDPSPTDYQTAFQVVVRNNTTDAILYDSGKVLSRNENHLGTIPSSSKETVLRWTVTLWDKDDVQGAAATEQTFYLADAPTVTVSSPTSGQVIATGIPSITFRAATTGGGRKITRYRAVWSKNGVPVHDSRDVILSTPVSAGVDITYRAPDTVFKNSTQYSAQVTITDEYGLEASSPLIPISTSFVVPATPTGLSVIYSLYGVEGGGFVQINWNDSGRDVDFQSWGIYRQDDLTDPSTGLVIRSGEMQLVGYVYEVNTAGYSFKDYYAPSGQRTTYYLTQMVNRFGDVVESLAASAVAFPVSEGYWLIQEDDNSGSVKDIIKLHNVTTDDYTDEYEEAVYTVIGRGRHVDRGDKLGKNGTLAAQIRDSANKSARQRKIELEEMRDENIGMYIRDPFGDVFKAYIGNIQISRVAGVGTSEFVDITIPYSEVY